MDGWMDGWMDRLGSRRWLVKERRRRRVRVRRGRALEKAACVGAESV